MIDPEETYYDHGRVDAAVQQPVVLPLGELCPETNFRLRVVELLREALDLRQRLKAQPNPRISEVLVEVDSRIESMQNLCGHEMFHRHSKHRMVKGPFAGHRVVWCAVCNKVLKAVDAP